MTKNEIDLSSLIIKNPTTWEDYALKGYAYLTLGNNTAAVTNFEKAATMNPRDVVLLNCWLQCLTNLGEPRRMKAVFDMIELVKPRKESDWDDHGLWLKDIDPKTVSDVRLVITTFTKTVPFKSEEEKELEKSLEENPNDANLWYRLGRVLARRNDDEEAIRAYKKSLEIKSDNSDAWLRLGDSLGYIGEHLEARDAFLKGIELDSENAILWRGLGVSYIPPFSYLLSSFLPRSENEVLDGLEKELKSDEVLAIPKEGLLKAEQAFKTATNLAKDDYVAWFFLGVLGIIMDNPIRPVSALRKSIQLKKDQYHAYFALALHYKNTGNKEQCAHMLKEGMANVYKYAGR